MMKLEVTTHEKLAKKDREENLAMTPEERLNLLELLRLEAGKFAYEYPTRLRRVITVTRRKSS
ncbi:hypothetical protein ACFL35_06685 [Candidatus Riflebacteria bacterium]